MDASAAYLTNSDGQIIARCIIFNNVTDETGTSWRLAERQYSTDSNDILKRALVDALIREGHIDGYKKIGAGCGDATEFVDIEGNSLSHHQFSIDCNLETYDAVSYQDSFKYYDLQHRVAYNTHHADAYYCLDITDGSIDDSEDDDCNYDEYHDCDTYNETVTVLYRGREMSCDAECLDDFCWVEKEQIWVHFEDVALCPECEEHYIPEDGCYSDLTQDYYCDEACRRVAEERFLKEHPELQAPKAEATASEIAEATVVAEAAA